MLTRTLATAICCVLLPLALSSCGDTAAPMPAPESVTQTEKLNNLQGEVTIRGDDSMASRLSWQRPRPQLDAEALSAALQNADSARQKGALYNNEAAAIPLYLEIIDTLDGYPANNPHPQDARLRAQAQRGLRQAAALLLDDASEFIEAADDDVALLAQAQQIAAVLRSLPAQTVDEDTLFALLGALDTLERVWHLNLQAEQDINAGRYAVQGGVGAFPKLQEVLRLRPQQARALRNLEAIEAGLIARAEAAAKEGDFSQAEDWLILAQGVRADAHTAIATARLHVQAERLSLLVRLHNQGTYALSQQRDNRKARLLLEQMLRIAPPGDANTADLRRRIDLDTHYGLFRPGQLFTDRFADGHRGPQMRVVPHGAFQMGSPADAHDAQSYEQPDRYVRFDRGFAMSVREVTVGEFRLYIQATHARTRAARRGFSMSYDERSGNFVRRGQVDWSSDYVGAPAAESMPVLHVSARDADDYARWLSEQTGQRYRLPSEAEFEYALRAGSNSSYPWGDGTPPDGAGNFTGALDASPSNRRWSNAFAGYQDGYWGPAPAGSFNANAFGLHDVAGNVSEWVADCWHDNFNRAPRDGSAWYNPGCRTRVIRGGAWANSPEQTRSAWRAPADSDLTNARIGFRVVRDL